MGYAEAIGGSKMKFILALALVSLSVVSSARANPTGQDGREEALSLCQGLNFSSQIEQCMGIVRQSRYFEIRAVSICTQFNFDSNKMECLSSIANKVYLEGEVTICGNMTFDSQKLSCFRSSGIPYSPNPSCPLDVQLLRSQLRFALSNLRTGNLRQADQTIVDLIIYLDRTPTP